MNRLLAGNKIFAAAPYKAPRPLKELLPTLDRCLIITCMDPRVIPEDFMGYKTSEFAAVRNAGGRVAQVEREIAFAAAAQDTTDLIIVHHEDCGVHNLNNATIRKRLAAKGLGDAGTATLDFGEINDLDQSVRDDVATLRASPYVSKKTNIRGYALELMTTGLLREVETSMGTQE